jgi:transcriptional regulator with PAS, ATPase and Fis domain
VRELQSTVERAILRHDGDGPLEASTLPTSLVTTDTVIRSFRSGRPTLKELERVYILWVLESSAGTKADVARTLGISRKSLWEKCKRFGIA